MSKNREVFELIHSSFEGNTELNQKNSSAPKENVGIQKNFLSAFGIHHRPKSIFSNDMLLLIVETKFIVCISRFWNSILLPEYGL